MHARGLLVLFATLPLAAAPLEVPEFKSDGWFLQDRVRADGTVRELQPGATISTAVKIPPLTDKEQEFGGDWRGVITIDFVGHTGDKPARLLFEAVDPATGEAFLSAPAAVTQKVEPASWSLLASSENADHPAIHAHDLDDRSLWLSKQHPDETEHPWISMELREPATVTALRYVPRADDSWQGVMKNYRVEVRRAEGAWQLAAEGQNEKSRKAVEIPLNGGQGIIAMRLVILSDWADSGLGSVGELTWVGLTLDPEPTLQKETTRIATERAWLEVPVAMMNALEEKAFGLRLRNGPDAPVVIESPRFARVHVRPTGGLFGRSNGGLGPDQLGAGLLGFDGLLEHDQTVPTVMRLHPKSAAAKAKMKEGDVLVAIGGKPFPINELGPGWNWLASSHEAFIGKMSEAALAAKMPSLPISVLRDGQVEVLEVPLARNRPFTTMIPASDPEAQVLLNDLLKYLVATQRDDGSWSGDMIRTSLSGLALLATEDPRHRTRVRKAINWAQQKHDKPDKFGNLGFWSAAYAGMLYAEWNLATGDRSVLKDIAAIRDWAVAGQHTSVWDVPALGHGPDGLPYENKALVAPACHLVLAEALGKRAGVESEIWELLMPYMEMAWSDPKENGHGALGYNRSYKDTEEFWSRSGLFAMACHLRNERLDMRDAMISFMAKHHPWMRNSHAYGEPGGALGLLALNLVDPKVYAEVIKQYAWWFSLAWEPGHGLHFTTPHMGAPYMGEQDLLNAAYALVLQAPKRSLAMTGRETDGR